MTSLYFLIFLMTILLFFLKGFLPFLVLFTKSLKINSEFHQFSLRMQNSVPCVKNKLFEQDSSESVIYLYAWNIFESTCFTSFCNKNLR